MLWFVPPWIGSGQPFLAASHAKDYNGHLGAHPLLEVLRRGVDLQVAPMLVLALVAVAFAWFRGRDRLRRARRGCRGWWVLVVAMTLDGYPGSSASTFRRPASPASRRSGGGARGAPVIGSCCERAGRGLAARSARATAGRRAVVVLISIPFSTARID